jgi:hypothetical protein
MVVVVPVTFISFDIQQASGFVKARNRRTGASSRMNDPSGAGLYVFSNRRWINPDDHEEITQLSEGISGLTERFPRFQLEQKTMVESLRRMLNIWDTCVFKYNPRKKKRASTSLPSDYNDQKATPQNMNSRSDFSVCNSAALFGPATAIRDAAWEPIVHGSNVDDYSSSTITAAEFAMADDPLFLTNPIDELFDDTGC